MSGDLAELLVRPGQPEIGFHSGTVQSWDPITGANTVEVAGAVLTDLPLLNSGELTVIRAGDVIGVLRVKAALFVLGRVIVPGAAPIARTTLSTASAYAEDPNLNLGTAWTLYGPADPDAAVIVPDGFAHAHVTLFVSAGSTLTTAGSISVQPAINAPSTGLVGGPAINSGNVASGPCVATSFWALELDVSPGDVLELGVMAIRVGSATANTGNWHLAASVMFTR